ncbi:hypothetical protein [Nocardioides dilutus]
MPSIRNRLTYSNVVSTLCLTLVLGGGVAVAAGIPPNSVGSIQIKNGNVKTADLKNNAVKTAKVKDGTLTGADVADGSLSAIDVLTDSLTAGNLAPNSVGQSEIATDGVAAAEIAANAVGQSEIATDGVAATEIQDNSIDSGEIVDNSLFSADLGLDSVRASELGTIIERTAVSANIPAGGNGSVTASCLAGEQLISGGNDGFFDVFVVASRQQGNGWAVFGHNDSGGNRTITAHAYCLQTS